MGAAEKKTHHKCVELLDCYLTFKNQYAQISPIKSFNPL